MFSRGEYNIGHLCRKEFGNRLYAIGFGTNGGTVAAASNWDGPMEIKSVLPSIAESYERCCHDSGIPSFCLDLHQSSMNGSADLRKPRLERAIGVIYRPETELASHYFQAILPQQFDEYIWFDRNQGRDAVRDQNARGDARHLSVWPLSRVAEASVRALLPIPPNGPDYCSNRSTNHLSSRIQISSLPTWSSMPCSRLGLSLTSITTMPSVGLLEVDAVEAVADRPRGAHRDVDHLAAAPGRDRRCGSRLRARSRRGGA